MNFRFHRKKRKWNFKRISFWFILQNKKFIFSGLQKKFFLALLRITNYIFRYWKMLKWMFYPRTRFLSTKNYNYVLNTHILGLGCPLVPTDGTYKRKKFGSFLILNYFDLFYIFSLLALILSDYILILASIVSNFSFSCWALFKALVDGAFVTGTPSCYSSLLCI